MVKKRGVLVVILLLLLAGWLGVALIVALQGQKRAKEQLASVLRIADYIGGIDARGDEDQRLSCA